VTGISATIFQIKRHRLQKKEHRKFDYSFTMRGSEKRIW